MYQLTSLDNSPKQRITMMVDDSIRVVFTFIYRPQQMGWFISFEYGGELYQNIRLTTSYNILRAYRNWLPFGLRCDTSDNEEPLDQDDFVNGYAKVYLLTKRDCRAVEGNFYAR